MNADDRTDSERKTYDWVADIRSFAESTGAHGLSHIFQGKNKFVRFLFLLAWLAAVVYTCYIITIGVITFFNKPTGTKYEILYVYNKTNLNTPQSIKFPTVSICSHNKVKKSYLNAKGNEAIRDYWSKIDMYDLNVLQQLNWSNPEYQKIANYTYQDVLAAGSPDDDRLLLCIQRNEFCNELLTEPGDYYVREESITGKCWRINPKGKLQGKGGDYGKMRIIMFADVQDYSERAADQPEYGFTVAFHDDSVYGSTLSSGYFMSPGSIYKVDLRLKQEKREPPPGGSCNTSLLHTSYGAYHEGACVMECKDAYLAARCGCVNVVPPLNLTTGTQYKSCTLKQWAECGLKTYLEFSKLYRDPNLTTNICPCPSACKETTYEAQLSSSALSPKYVESVFGKVEVWISQYLSKPEYGIVYNTSQDIADNVMVLDILFTSMATTEIGEVVTYEFENLLGDIGGVLGLFLGASIFSIIEFFQFVILLMTKRCFGRTQRSGDEPPQGPEVVKVPAAAGGEHFKNEAFKL